MIRTYWPKDTSMVSLCRCKLRRIFACLLCGVLAGTIFMTVKNAPSQGVYHHVGQRLSVMDYAVQHVDFRLPTPKKANLDDSVAVVEGEEKFELKRKPLTKNQLEVSERVKGYMEDRRQQVASVCASHPELQLSNLSTVTIVERRHKLLYCPMPKVASTFWSRVFYQLLYSNPVASPFNVKVTDVDPRVFSRYLLTNFDQIARILPSQPAKSLVKAVTSNLTNLVYVRDPLSRMFSAYVDKLLAPNPLLWHRWGYKYVQLYGTRHQRKDINIYCHHNTTFRQFAQLVETFLWNRDVHTMTITDRCSPCLLDFHVIGKMETFQQDALYLLTKLNISETQMEFDRMEEDMTADAIEDSIKDSLSPEWLKLSLKCVTKDVILRRILRKLQIRGLISWRYRYPYTAEQAEDVTFPGYKRVLLEAKGHFWNKTELSLQKKQAFLEAFSTVPQELYRRLWKRYQMDLDMFGTPKLLPSPDTQMSELTNVNTNAFDYDRDWDLTPLLKDIQTRA